MSALDGYVYVACEDRIWRATPSSGDYHAITETGWNGTTAMTALHGNLYVIWEKNLYRMDPNGNYNNLGADWSGVTSITPLSGYLYLIKDDMLFRIDPNDGSWLYMASCHGEGKASLVTYAGKLYVIQAGTGLWVAHIPTWKS
jgi:hypothetical protein